MADVIEVRYVRDYTVWVRFDDGVEGEVDIHARSRVLCLSRSETSKPSSE